MSNAVHAHQRRWGCCWWKLVLSPLPLPQSPLLRPRRKTKVLTEGIRGSVLPRAACSSLSSKLVCRSVRDTRASKGRQQQCLA